MEKHYCFAGREVTVIIPDEWMYEEDGHLSPFRIGSVTDPHIFSFEPVVSLEAPAGTPKADPPGMRIFQDGEREIRYFGSVQNGWENAYIRVEHKKKNSHVQVKIQEKIRKIGVKTVLNAMSAERLLAGSDAIAFHCSYIDRGGEAILFTAPSETGKSTQADLWHQYRGAEIINGDRAAIRLAEGKLLAEGIPFAGSSPYCRNRSLPIRAIVYLGQAPRTTIRKLRGYEAFSKIWEGVSVNTWDREDMERVSAVVQKVAAEIPIYHMPCTPDESAILALEEALRKQVIL